jgi:peptidoglycan/LPS O-acetylase OafA/YrhL
MLLNLTGIRGIAALWVLSFHFNHDFISKLPGQFILLPIVRVGYFGVDLFFCLSGFIIGYVYLESFVNRSSSQLELVRNFLFKRFARLYPVYFITTFSALILISVAKLVNHEFNQLEINILSPSITAKNLFMIQSWDSSPSLNYPAWSVSAEFFAYLIFPLLTSLMFGRAGWMKCKAIFLMLIAISAHTYSVLAPDFGNSALNQVMTEFSMGFCAYILIRDIRLSKRLTLAIRRLIVILIILFLYLIENASARSTLIPLFLLLLCCANYSYNIPSRGLSRKWIVKFGVWSYSIYLTHGLIGYFLSGAGLPLASDSVLLNGFQTFLLFAVVICCGALVTNYIENPARKYLLSRFIT